LTETRNRIADSVVSRCREILDDWETGFTIEGHFRPGWRQGSDLESALLERLDDDLQRGFTGLGPQRADIEFIQGGGLAEKRLSRGQQKILVAALNLAILDIVSGERGETWRPIMLIDDLGSELDVQNQERIITDLCRRGIQAFVAMISIEATLGVAESAVKVFHVEHGAIK
jgi:DNA replication and repair protein RecF